MEGRFPNSPRSCRRRFSSRFPRASVVACGLESGLMPLGQGRRRSRGRGLRSTTGERDAAIARLRGEIAASLFLAISDFCLPRRLGGSPTTRVPEDPAKGLPAIGISVVPRQRLAVGQFVWAGIGKAVWPAPGAPPGRATSPGRFPSGPARHSRGAPGARGEPASTSLRRP